jgi:NADPH2:quinone reductase
MATPKTTKAILFTGSPTATYSNPAPITSLILNPSQQTPVPSPTQHLIRVHATAITPYEASWPTSRFPHPEPRIPCHDTAGTIISSPEDSPFQPGDRVFCLLPFVNQGEMAEYAVVEEEFLVKMPDGMDFVEAASVPRAALTSGQALRVRGGGYLKDGMKVLITGATGAVGRMGVQISLELRYIGNSYSSDTHSEIIRILVFGDYREGENANERHSVIQTDHQTV